QYTGIEYKHVTYEGGNPAVIATVRGETEVVPQLACEEVDMIRAKKLRPLAVLDSKALELEKELNRIKKQGFALDRGENEKDVRCIAAPIRNFQGKIIAAVSISGPAFRIDVNTRNNQKEALLEISKKISRRLGYDNRLKNEGGENYRKI
ncbi:unnamed protein product, partial [marine sediment metagenome]